MLFFFILWAHFVLTKKLPVLHLKSSLLVLLQNFYSENSDSSNFGIRPGHQGIRILQTILRPPGLPGKAARIPL